MSVSTHSKPPGGGFASAAHPIEECSMTFWAAERVVLVLSDTRNHAITWAHVFMECLAPCTAYGSTCAHGLCAFQRESAYTTLYMFMLRESSS